MINLHSVFSICLISLTIFAPCSWAQTIDVTQAISALQTATIGTYKTSSSQQSGRQCFWKLCWSRQTNSTARK